MLFVHANGLPLKLSDGSLNKNYVHGSKEFVGDFVD